MCRFLNGSSSLLSKKQEPTPDPGFGGRQWLGFPYQLARRKHLVAAIDLLTNTKDGLGAYVHYDASFTPIQADFDALPLVDRQLMSSYSMLLSIIPRNMRHP